MTPSFYLLLAQPRLKREKEGVGPSGEWPFLAHKKGRSYLPGLMGLWSLVQESTAKPTITKAPTTTAIMGSVNNNVAPRLPTMHAVTNATLSLFITFSFLRFLGVGLAADSQVGNKAT